MFIIRRGENMDSVIYIRIKKSNGDYAASQFNIAEIAVQDNYSKKKLEEYLQKRVEDVICSIINQIDF